MTGPVWHNLHLCLQLVPNGLKTLVLQPRNKNARKEEIMKGRERTRLSAYRKLNPRSDRLGVFSPRCSGLGYLRDLVCTHIQQENLGADVRIDAERKLKALEADLVVAETANKERALAARYHKVKFFGACYCSSYLLCAFSNENQIARSSCVKSGRQKGNSRTKISHRRIGKLSRQNCSI